MGTPSAADKRENLRTVLSVIRAGDLAQARDLLRTLLKAYPNDAEVWFTAALAAENRTQQIKILKRSVSLDPEFSPAVKLLDDLESQQLLDSIQGEGEPAALKSASKPQTAGPKSSPSASPVAQASRPTRQSRRRLVIVVVGVGIAVILAVLVLRQIMAPAAPPTGSLSAINSLTASVSATSPADSSSTIKSPIDPLPYQSVAAAYSVALDRVIIVSSAPVPALQIYDPEMKTEQIIALPKAPTCLGLSADGKFAAVGYDGGVSYLDLQAAKLVKTLDLLAVATSVVVANNGWIYVASEGNQLGYFHMLQISTNTDSTAKTPGGLMGVHGKLVLAADGMSFYQIVQNGLLSDMYRYFLTSDGTISGFRQWSNRDTYNHCGNAWPSADGKRLITACGAIFRLSTDPIQDMTYNGSLANVGKVYSAAQSLAANTIIAFVTLSLPPGSGPDLSSSSPSLYFFDNTSLSQSSHLRLPNFSNGKQANGQFVFTNAAGTRYYVLVTSVDTEGIPGVTPPTADSVAGVFAADVPGAVVIATSSPMSVPSATSSPVSTPSATSSPVSVSSPIHMLDFSVDDAVYSQALDRIIISSADPNALIIYDPVNNQKVTVALSRVPLSLALSSDGLYAAVGHDASISIIDLKAAKLLNTYDVPVKVTNLDLAPNGYIYIFPEGQWTSLYTVNVKTGAVTSHIESFIWGTGSSILYQDGKRIYYGQNGSSPSTLYRVDLRDDGTAVQEQKWPYWGEYSPCGQFWLSKDGKRLFTACGTVFKTSSDPKQDMTYNGTFAQTLFPDKFHWLTYSAIMHALQAKLIYALPNMDAVKGLDSFNRTPPSKQKLLVFDYDSLQYLTALDVPQFVTQNATPVAIDGQGYYMFVNGQGSQLYIIMEADKGSGMLNDFGIWTTEIVRPKATSP